MRGEAKNIHKGEVVRKKILKGAKAVYEAVSATYGPVSGNVMIEKSYDNIVTHDGVSVARDVYLSDKVEDFGASIIVKASEKSNAISGDGTSCTVILAYHILKEANRQRLAGANAMKLRRGINKAGKDIIATLKKQAVQINGEDLAKIASISASDPEVGKLVADTISEVGVGVSIEEYKGLGLVQEIINGFYFESGYASPEFVKDPQSFSIDFDGHVLVTNKKISENQDILPILQWVNEQPLKQIVIVGHVQGEALSTCILNNRVSSIKVCVVNPPVYGDQELPFLEDCATYVGGQVVPESLPIGELSPEYFGKSKIKITGTDTTIINKDVDQKAVQERIDSINKQLSDGKVDEFRKERLEFRLAKLQAKIGVIKVGGATELDVKELKHRVEDAVHATRAAKEDGVVAGGATTLARISKDQPPFIMDNDEAIGYACVYKALAEPFNQLMANAGEDPAYRYNQLIRSPKGYGFDVRNMAEDPHKIPEILDPVRVLLSAVENATAVAGLAITVSTAVTIDREWQLQQVEFNKNKI